jgi:hypothetical protein
MKKITALLALLLAFVMIFAACAPAATTEQPSVPTDGGITTGNTSGTTKGTTATTAPVTPDPEKKTIKILSIGNSFSDDATQWLGSILLDMGYDIYLGNLYIGGCSIDTHWANAQSGEKAYDYRTCQWGTWKSTKQSLEYGIKAQEWDIITVQQVSQNSGMPETFGNLQNLLDFVNSKKKNPDAKVFWHMTWAYESDSTHSGFVNYNGDQMTMYNAIVNAAKEKILTNNAFTGVIPSGTAVQNLRTSYLGDHITRDGYHLSYDVGRYTAALTWAKLLTGESIDAVDYIPKEYPNIANHLPAIKEAVNNAVAKPLEVTPATITTHESMTMTQADKDFLTAQGKNPDDYHLIDLDLMLNSYYNSGTNSTRNSKAANSKGEILNYYFSTDMFVKNDLPVGTIIRINEGYQYRPEAWTATNVKTNPRPDNVTQNAVVVDAAWWGDYNYRAFNIAYVGAATAVTEADLKAFQIYVPNAPVAVEPEEPAEKPELDAKTTDEAMTLAGYDLTKYTKVDITEYLHEYYISNSKAMTLQNKTTAPSATNLTYFWATQIFSKTDIPEGAVLVCLNGYQYRPEGWQTMSSNNTGARPDNVLGSKATVTVVDAAWWGNFNYRAFNVAKQGGSTNVSADDYAVFAIYVPKAN